MLILSNTLCISSRDFHQPANPLVEVSQCCRRSCGGDKWNSLFRLCCHLRCAPDGADAAWIKNPRNQNRTRKLNWFQENCQKLAKLQQRSVSARDRVRAGRLERWRQQGEKLRESFAVPLAQPEVLESLEQRSKHVSTCFDQMKRYCMMFVWFFNVFNGVSMFSMFFLPRSGNVVLFVSRKRTIDVGMVLTVWRVGQRKKVCVNPTSVEACYAFRVVELERVKDSKIEKT